MEELRKIRDEVSSENIILKKENVRLNSELELSLVNNLANLALLEVLQNNSDLIEQLNSFTLVSQIETVKHKEAIMTLNEQISMLEEGTIQNFCSLVEMNIFASDGSENFVTMPAGVCWSDVQFYELSRESLEQNLIIPDSNGVGLGTTDY